VTGSEPIGDFSVRYVLSRTMQLVRLNPVQVGVALLVLIAMGVISDTETLGDGRGPTLVTSLIALAFQYSLTKRLLDQTGVGAATSARFAALFGLNFLSTIAIVAGLVVLVAPGLFLVVRWSLSVPILLGPDEPGIIESLRRSWRETQGRFWPILAVYALIWAISAAAIGGGVLMENLVLGSILANLGLNAGLIVGWHAAVAIYNRSERDATLEEVFA
jgi:hypothetical protein